MARINLNLSDDLDRELDVAAEESHTTKSDVFRKALQLYLAARAGAKDGKVVGLGDKTTRVLETEFIGL